MTRPSCDSPGTYFIVTEIRVEKVNKSIGQYASNEEDSNEIVPGHGFSYI